MTPYISWEMTSTSIGGEKQAIDYLSHDGKRKKSSYSRHIWLFFMELLIYIKISRFALLTNFEKKFILYEI